MLLPDRSRAQDRVGARRGREPARDARPTGGVCDGSLEGSAGDGSLEGSAGPAGSTGVGDDRRVVAARRPLGQIAGADAAASPHTDAAIREAHRAVREVLAAD